MHTSPWPTVADRPGDPAVLVAASEALIGIRRAKTEAKASQKTPVAHATIEGTDATIAALRLAEGDLRAVGRIENIEFIPGETTRVSAIELAPEA